MVEFQFLEPKTVDDKLIPVDNDGIQDEKKPGLLDFSKPSDFHMKAVKAKKDGFNATGDDSHLSSSLDREGSLKSDGSPVYECKIIFKLPYCKVYARF